MGLPAFDSHKFVKKFTASGFNESQSEVLVELVLESQNHNIDALATKEQLSNVEESLKKDIRTLEDKLSQEIKTSASDTKTSILMWMIPLLSANALTLVGLYAQAFFTR